MQFVSRGEYLYMVQPTINCATLSYGEGSFLVF